MTLSLDSYWAFLKHHICNKKDTKFGSQNFGNQIWFCTKSGFVPDWSRQCSNTFQALNYKNGPNLTIFGWGMGIFYHIFQDIWLQIIQECTVFLGKLTMSYVNHTVSCQKHPASSKASAHSQKDCIWRKPSTRHTQIWKIWNAVHSCNYGLHLIQSIKKWIKIFSLLLC